MKIQSLKKSLLFFVTVFLSLTLSSVSYANVRMTGTRIIYNANSKSVDVNLRNSMSFPYVVQTWLDQGDMSTGPNDKTGIPFAITPPIFKMQPNSSQVVRIVYTGEKALPQDRESVFYFNFLEIPPANIGGADYADKNKMVVTVRSRVKLFYRPAGLKGNPEQVFETLEIKRVQSGNKLGIQVTNNQPFHASLSQIAFTTKNNTYQMKAEMIEPFSSKTFFFDKVSANTAGKVTLTLVNDYGARVIRSYSL